MKYTLLIAILISLNSNAQTSPDATQSGQVISAIDYNNSKFTIGDIKQTMLPESEFVKLHGTCWKQLNKGQDLENNTSRVATPDGLIDDINITGTSLATALNTNYIKSSAGRFLRSEGAGSETLGDTQEDSLKSHKHEISYVRVDLGGTNGGLIDGVTTGHGVLAWGGNTGTILNSGTHSTNKTNPLDALGSIHEAGSGENMVKNLTVNTFIKVDHSCN